MRKLWPGLFVMALATAFGFWALPQLPEQVASHWGLDGAVNGTTTRLVLVVLVPLLGFAMAGVLTIAPHLDPKRRNFPMHAGSYWLVTNLLLVFLAFLHVLVIGFNLGWPIHLQEVMMPGLGVLFIVIGNVLTRVRPNWIFGIRTPWTLTSELSWRESHRVGGYGFVVVGALVLLTSLVKPSASIYVMLFGIGGVSLLSVAWSYFAWKRDPQSTGRDG
jgi:uncharacterized membrane protein